MNFGLTDEQEMVVNTVRTFVENEIYPLEKEVETSAPVKTSLFYDTGGTVFRRRVGRGSLFTSSPGGSGFLSQGREQTPTGLRRY